MIIDVLYKVPVVNLDKLIKLDSRLRRNRKIRGHYAGFSTMANEVTLHFDGEMTIKGQVDLDKLTKKYGLIEKSAFDEHFSGEN